MPYVMMPVPEEFVEEVMQFILRATARRAITPWDAESITRLYDEVDEGSRSLLAFVARAAASGEELAAADAARRIQLTPVRPSGSSTSSPRRPGRRTDPPSSRSAPSPSGCRTGEPRTSGCCRWIRRFPSSSGPRRRLNLPR